ncbi:MAG: hypothetical protein GF331_15535 [Chitinivibrionales bacterium]|nr:hypothetical protein [Chitinivibrionales bacterium]
MFEYETHRLEGADFDWYYVIGPRVNSEHVVIDSMARYVFGREGGGDLFSTWHGAAFITDSTRQQSGLWRDSSMWYPFSAYFDSAYLVDIFRAGFLDPWKWDDTDRQGKLIVQLIRTDYDTTMPAAVRYPSRGHAPIALGLSREQSMTVFDPLGRLVARQPGGMSAQLPKTCYVLRIAHGGHVLHVKEMALRR